MFITGRKVDSIQNSKLLIPDPSLTNSFLKSALEIKMRFAIPKSSSFNCFFCASAFL